MTATTLTPERLLTFLRTSTERTFSLSLSSARDRISALLGIRLRPHNLANCSFTSVRSIFSSGDRFKTSRSISLQTSRGFRSGGIRGSQMMMALWSKLPINKVVAQVSQKELSTALAYLFDRSRNA